MGLLCTVDCGDWWCLYTEMKPYQGNSVMICKQVTKAGLCMVRKLKAFILLSELNSTRNTMALLRDISIRICDHKK